MYAFFVIVAAIVTSQVIIGAIGLSIVFSKPVIKWYAKKVYKMSQMMEEELNSMVQNEEEL